MPGIEITDVTIEPATVDGWIDQPARGIRAATRGLDVEGWALGRDGEVRSVEVVCDRTVLWTGPADRPRPDVASAFPDRAGAGRCGFRSAFFDVVPIGEIVVSAVLDDGRRSALATIRTRRRDDVDPTPEPLVLLYHRVADVEVDPWALAVSPGRFREHLEILRRDWRPMRLDELVAATLDGNPPSDAVAVTFDDGYADVLDNAFPALEAADVPATVFLPSALVGRDEPFWWDELAAIVLGDGDASWRAWEPATSPRQTQYRDLWNRLRTLDEADRRVRVRGLREAEVGRLAGVGRCLSRDEVARLARSGLVGFGSHSRTHPVLGVLSSEEQRSEISGSRRELEDVLGTPVSSFAYPYGKPGDLGDATVALVREAGYATAFCNVDGSLTSGCDPYRLPRLFVQDWDGDELSRRLRRWSAA